MKNEILCGLIGEHLKHSFSPAIHNSLCGYEYRLFELEENELGDFLKNYPFHGVNVTIPYKKTVIPFCDELSDAAERIGAVNTILRREDGSLYGHNTDYDGFKWLAEHSGTRIEGKKTVVLGTGGASLTVCTVLRDMGIGELVNVSRRGEDNYENVSRHFDADIIVNSTPVGMYPCNGSTPLSLEGFYRLEAVFDVIYNPAKTALLLDAERRGIKTANGLGMLVAQAKAAAELFSGESISDEKAESVLNKIRRDTENIMLIGMPGSGKTSIAGELAKKLGRKLVSVDAMIEENAGMSIPQIFSSFGEDAFREMEHQAMEKLGRESGLVIDCGGGVVTRPQNHDPMRQNSVIVWIKRDSKLLCREGRPLSAGSDLDEMYRRREPLYRELSDLAVENDGSIDDAVKKILEVTGY